MTGMALDLITATGMLVLVVAGLALILGLMDVINLAQTGLMTVGVYATIGLWRAGANVWLAMAGGAIATALSVSYTHLTLPTIYSV